MEHSKQDLIDLYDGNLRWEKVKEIMSQPKDNDRFDKYIEILQERVPWSEKILLPLNEHLHVVQKNDERIVKCDCGQEFGDYRRNWKLSALIYARDDRQKLEEIFPGVKCPDPDLCEVREFYCPGCGSMLKVESVPVGHPIIFDFLPDIDSFYRDWLGRPLPDEKEFRDMSHEITQGWSEKHG
ncbi:acetone carboxylase subunit gamma [Chloroflexota bacterium]